jgi:hypothetical protein
MRDKMIYEAEIRKRTQDFRLKKNLTLQILADRTGSPKGCFQIQLSTIKLFDLDEKIELSLKQGRAVFGVDMKIVDGSGKELPWDGKAFGNLLVRGP